MNTHINFTHIHQLNILQHLLHVSPSLPMTHTHNPNFLLKKFIIDTIIASNIVMFEFPQWSQ